jgi:transposase
VVRLMTIAGIGPVVASMVLASIGDICDVEKLSCYFGLTPKVRQSDARHGRICEQRNIVFSESWRCGLSRWA